MDILIVEEVKMDAALADAEKQLACALEAAANRGVADIENDGQVLYWRGMCSTCWALINDAKTITGAGVRTKEMA